MDEELLQEGPVTLDLTTEHDDFGDASKGLLPLDALLFEGGEVARGEHRVDLGLVLFEHLEVFFRELEHLDIAALMLLELELDVLPESFNVVEGLLHLSLLVGLISDLLNVFGDLTELEVVDVLELEVVIDLEVGLGLLTDHVPMAFTHRGVSKLTAEGQELEPLLDLFEDANVSVALLVNLHALESSLELLDLFLHVVGLGLLPGVVHVSLEDGLAVGDVVPKTLEEADLVLDLANLGLGAFNHLGVLKLVRVVLELVSLLNEVVNLAVDLLEGAECGLAASVVPVEVALLHGSDVSLQVFLVAGDSCDVLLALGVDKGSDLLLDILGKLLERSPFIEEFLAKLDFLFFLDSVGGEELEGLVELVENERGLVVEGVDLGHVVLDAHEGLHIAQILVLAGSTGGGLLHEGLLGGDLLLSEFQEGRTGQVVGVGWGCGVEGSSIGGTTHVLPDALVVLVGNLDIDIAFVVDSVLDVVLAIVRVGDLGLDLLWLFLAGGDSHLEVVTARGTVLLVLVTGLNDELDGLADAEVLEHARSIAERLLGLGVKEEVELGVGRGQIVAGELNLHNGDVTLVTKVGGHRGELGLGNEGSLDAGSALGSSSDGGLAAWGEVDRA